MAHAETISPSQISAMKMVKQLEQWRASKDALLTQGLLAYPEDHYYETHEAPKMALLCLADLFTSHAQATLNAKNAGARGDDFSYTEPEHMSALLGIIARSMTASTTSVDYALQIRAMHGQIAEESYHENTH